MNTATFANYLLAYHRARDRAIGIADDTPLVEALREATVELARLNATRYEMALACRGIIHANRARLVEIREQVAAGKPPEADVRMLVNQAHLAAAILAELEAGSG